MATMTDIDETARARKNQQAREARAANPEKYREQYTRYNAAAKEYRRDRHLRQTYGISAVEFDALVAAQGGVCAICQKPETAKQNGKVRALCMDHNHQTGARRGALCTSCNARLHVFETWEFQKRARDYLADWVD